MDQQEEIEELSRRLSELEKRTDWCKHYRQLSKEEIKERRDFVKKMNKGSLIVISIIILLALALSIIF